MRLQVWKPVIKQSWKASTQGLDFSKHFGSAFQTRELWLPDFEAGFVEFRPRRSATIGDDRHSVVVLTGGDEGGIDAHVGGNAGHDEMGNLLTT